MRSVNFVQRVADRFRQSPGTWINALELEAVGGRFAWRTRVSDCRKQFGMVIENRVRTVTQDGRVFKISEYKFVPDGDEFRLTG